MAPECRQSTARGELIMRNILITSAWLVVLSLQPISAAEPSASSKPEPVPQKAPAANPTPAKDTDDDAAPDPVTGWQSLLEHSDLKITPEQREKIRVLMGKVRADLEQAKAAASNEKIREAAMAQLKVRSALLMQKYQGEVNDILTPQQKQRLEQLVFRIRGVSTLQDDNIAEYLKLTPQQRDKIKDLIKKNEDQRKELRQTRPVTREDRIAKRDKRRTLRHEHQDLLKQVLTPEQLKEYESLQGPPPSQPLPENVPFSSDSPLEDGVELGSPAPFKK